MFSLELECRAKHKDLLIAELWEQGCCGVVELDANHIRAFFDDQAGADRLRKQFRAFGARLRVEEDRDWVEFSREKWEPLPVGSRFYLVPEWRDDPAPEGRFRITVNPGLAFGTGIPETTRLCLEALEEHVQPDMVAVEVAARNTEVSPVPVRFFVGSVGAMAAGSADLVVANISPEVTMELAADLLRILRPGSLALVSGFERNEIADIQAAMTKAGAEIEGTRFKGSWALVATRKSFRRG